MNKYEALYIIRSATEEEGRKQLIEKFAEVVKSNGGEVDSIDEWGQKRLAYLIEKETDGYYVLMNFTAASEVPMELERNFQITDDVLRYLVTLRQK